MIKSFKTRIYPTETQKEYFHKAFGVRRWTWNWGLNTYLESLNDKPKSSYDLQKELNNGLVKDPNYKWLKEVNSMVRQESLKDLGLSIKRYHDEQRKARQTTQTVNTEKYKPKFKSKKRAINSFRLNNKNELKILSDYHFSIVTVGSVKNRFKIKSAEKVRFLKDTKFCTITISESVGKYYACVTYETTNHKKRRRNNLKVGIDMGIKTPMTCVFKKNGKLKAKKYNIPKSLYKQEKKTERIQKLLSKKVYGSNNYFKIKQRLQKSFMKEVNIKKDFREKLTTMLARSCSVINLETYSHTSGLNIKCGRALSRVSGYELVELKNQ